MTCEYCDLENFTQADDGAWEGPVYGNASRSCQLVKSTSGWWELYIRDGEQQADFTVCFCPHCGEQLTTLIVHVY